MKKHNKKTEEREDSYYKEQEANNELDKNCSVVGRSINDNDISQLFLGGLSLSIPKDKCDNRPE